MDETIEATQYDPEVGSFEVTLVAKDWNIHRITCGNLMRETPERECENEYARHIEKRQEYFRKITENVRNMKKGKKATLHLSEYDFHQLQKTFGYQDIEILSTERCKKSRKIRLNVEVMKL